MDNFIEETPQGIYIDQEQRGNENPRAPEKMMA